MLPKGHFGSVTSRPSEGRDVTENHVGYMAAHGLVVLGNKNHDASELQASTRRGVTLYLFGGARAPPMLSWAPPMFLSAPPMFSFDFLQYKRERYYSQISHWNYFFQKCIQIVAF